MHGKGVYTWSDGRRYEGEYNNDKKEGYGIYTWADGRRYQGYWLNGKQHGKGKYISNEGVIKWGNWDDGKRINWIEPENDEDAFKYKDGTKVPTVVIPKKFDKKDPPTPELGGMKGNNISP